VVLSDGFEITVLNAKPKQNDTPITKIINDVFSFVPVYNGFIDDRIRLSENTN
jgi:hypothetical protein